MLVTLPVKKEVHTSDRLAYKRCRRKWQLGSYMCKNLRPITLNDKLWLGTGIHFALSEYYLPDKKADLCQTFEDWCDEQITEMQKKSNLWQEQLDLINELRALGLGILDHYGKWAAKEDPKWFSKVITTEQEFRVPILTPDGKPTEWTYAGRMDGIVEDQNGLLWLLEHKTAKAFDTDKLPLDEQCGSYIWAAQQLYGYKLEGVIYNQMKKKLPIVPPELKKGGLSQNKQMDTTLDTYLAALDDYYGGRQNVPMASYSDYLNMLVDKGNQFFCRTKVYRSQKEIEDIGRRIYYEMAEMQRGDLVCYPNPTRDCAWDCDFRSVCMSMNDGSDYDYMLDELFEVRPVEEGIERVVDE